MDRKSDPRFMSDFGGHKGVEAKDSPLLKPGAKDSIGSESNVLKPFTTDFSAKSHGPFGGEAKLK